nr:MAG TPA: Serine/threonine-protein kinase 4 [Caudoviricetes sp.]
MSLLTRRTEMTRKMNKNAHVIDISHEAMSSMTEDELRAAMQAELAKIEAEYNCKKKTIIDDYDPYIKAAKDRQGFDKLNMLRKLIDEMDIADVRFALNTTGYIVLTRSESEAIINYMGIKSIFDEVFK